MKCLKISICVWNTFKDTSHHLCKVSLTDFEMNFFILYLFHTIDIMRFTILQRWILECRENEGFSVSNTARQEKNLGQDSTPPDAEFCN